MLVQTLKCLTGTCARPREVGDQQTLICREAPHVSSVLSARGKGNDSTGEMGTDFTDS